MAKKEKDKQTNNSTQDTTYKTKDLARRTGGYLDALEGYILTDIWKINFKIQKGISFNPTIPFIKHCN